MNQWVRRSPNRDQRRISPMDHFDRRQFATPQALAESAAADCLEQISTAREEGAIFSLALSGGRIAQTFCAALARLIKTRETAVEHMHFFWSDERCVSPDDPESNFRLANELLLRPLGISPSQIHRLEGEKPGEQSFARAEADLRKLVAFTAAGQPILSLVLLGMGEDGHVASLFPGEPEPAMASPRIFRCVTAVKPPPERITMGYAAIAAAKEAWVLASGSGKAEALRESLRPGGGTPLARVGQRRQSLRIYSDIPAESSSAGS
jgi:6-phosphogluconolactonase